MKTLFLLSLILLGASCKEEEIQSFNDLDSDEQTAIRNMGTQQCISKVTSTFNRYKTKSNEVFTSSSYNREDGFYFVFKKDSVEEKTVDIQVWKQTPTEIYFYIIDSRASENYFLRVTKTENEQMIDDLLASFCARPNPFESSSVGDNGPLKLTQEYELNRTPNDEVYKDSYSLPFSQLPYFANFGVSRTLTYEDDDDNQVGNAVQYTSTLTAKGVDFNTDNWADTSEFTQRFCKIERNGTYLLTKERGLEGFKIDLSDPADCPTTKPADWNMDI